MRRIRRDRLEEEDDVRRTDPKPLSGNIRRKDPTQGPEWGATPDAARRDAAAGAFDHDDPGDEFADFQFTKERAIATADFEEALATYDAGSPVSWYQTGPIFSWEFCFFGDREGREFQFPVWAEARKDGAIVVGRGKNNAMVGKDPKKWGLSGEVGSTKDPREAVGMVVAECKRFWDMGWPGKKVAEDRASARSALTDVELAALDLAAKKAADAGWKVGDDVDKIPASEETRKFIRKNLDEFNRRVRKMDKGLDHKIKAVSESETDALAKRVLRLADSIVRRRSAVFESDDFDSVVQAINACLTQGKGYYGYMGWNFATKDAADLDARMARLKAIFKDWTIEMDASDARSVEFEAEQGDLGVKITAGYKNNFIKVDLHNRERHVDADEDEDEDVASHIMAGRGRHDHSDHLYEEDEVLSSEVEAEEESSRSAKDVAVAVIEDLEDEGIKMARLPLIGGDKRHEAYGDFKDGEETMVRNALKRVAEKNGLEDVTSRLKDHLGGAEGFRAMYSVVYQGEFEGGVVTLSSSSLIGQIDVVVSKDRGNLISDEPGENDLNEDADLPIPDGEQDQGPQLPTNMTDLFQTLMDELGHMGFVEDPTYQRTSYKHDPIRALTGQTRESRHLVSADLYPYHIEGLLKELGFVAKNAPGDRSEANRGSIRMVKTLFGHGSIVVHGTWRPDQESGGHVTEIDIRVQQGLMNEGRRDGKIWRR